MYFQISQMLSADLYFTDLQHEERLQAKNVPSTLLKNRMLDCRSSFVLWHSYGLCDASVRSQCIIRLYNSNHMGEKGTMVGSHGWGGEWWKWWGGGEWGYVIHKPQPRYYIALVVAPASLCYGSDLRLCYVSPAIETWSPGSRDGGDVFSWGISKIN